MSSTTEVARDRVSSVKAWYHSIEVAPGIVTPGAFDTRVAATQVPWPDLTGKRCLDVGTFDGFWAFEMERRGAREVVATDLSDQSQWDWPPAERDSGIAAMERDRAPVGHGFSVAHDLLQSSVKRIECNIYDLHPDRVGMFDVVFCGDLMLHLRDPMRAIIAMGSVCHQHLISCENLDPWLTFAHRRRPVVAFNIGIGPRQWWVPNAAAHRSMVAASGFTVDAVSSLFAVPFGAGFAQHHKSSRSHRIKMQASRLMTRGEHGGLHQAVRGRPI